MSWPGWNAARLFAAGLLGVALTAAAQTPPELPSGWTDKSIVDTDYDMVAAANPLAVDAGVEILRKGGNALDAAIAVQMVLNLVEPQSSGIGGGAFMLLYDARARSLDAWDGREVAPAAATPNLFIGADGRPLGFNDAVVGGRSVGVPGALRMLESAHREKGRLPWSVLFEPAIRLAESGFAISPRMFSATSADTFLRTQEPAASYFYNPDKTPKPIGTILRNPDLADVFRRIARDGSDAFYKGTLAAEIVAKIQGHPTNPGLMTLADLANYAPKKRAPICGTYRGRWNICGMGMPSSGGATVLQTLGILENFDVAARRPNTAEAVHLISEAQRLAYADRGLYMADSDFVNVPVAGLVDKNYLRQRSQQISLTRSMGTPQPGRPPGASEDFGKGTDLDVQSTSHMSIVDEEGNVVSMTTTIETGFGSRQMVRGFLLNNQLTDFSFTATDSTGAPVANRVQAGKRPRSSMSPTIVFDPEGRVEMVIGSPGGSQIIQYVTKALIGVFDWNLDIQQAINLGNFGAQTTATTLLERASSVKDLGPGLQALGHTVSVVDINSGLHGITFRGVRDSADRGGLLSIILPYGGWSGGADPRREGTAKGR